MKETTKGADFFHSTTVCVDAILAKTQRSVGVCPTSNKTQPPRHCVIKSRHLWASLNTLLSLLHAHQPYFFSSDKSSLFLLGPLHLAATSAQNTLLPGCSTCFNLSFMTQLIHHLLRDVFPGPLLMVHSLHNHQPLSLCSCVFFMAVFPIGNILFICLFCCFCLCLLSNIGTPRAGTLFVLSTNISPENWISAYWQFSINACCLNESINK